jgi:hypothetical protein
MLNFDKLNLTNIVSILIQKTVNAIQAWSISIQSERSGDPALAGQPVGAQRRSRFSGATSRSAAKIPLCGTTSNK